MGKFMQYPTMAIAMAFLLFSNCGKSTESKNQPPVLSSIGDQQGDEGGELRFTVGATDPDEDVVVYSATDLPQGAVFDEETGTFAWTPTHQQAGTYTVIFRASDGELTDEQSITLVVNDVITAPELASEGWTLFQDGNIADAQAKFEEAIALDASSADAYNGKGWCLLRQNALAEAKQSFDLAISNGLPTADALVGRAAAHRDLPDLPSAIQDALAALSLDPNYRFAYDSTIDYHDVRIILAQSYFGIADYPNAQQQVNILDSENGLDPENSTKWVVGGMSYNTYQEALLMKIEALEEMFGTP